MSEDHPPKGLPEEKNVDPAEGSTLNNGSIRIMKPATISMEVRRSVLRRILLQGQEEPDSDHTQDDAQDSDDEPLSSQDVPDAWRDYLKASLPKGNWLALWDANPSDELDSRRASQDLRHDSSTSNRRSSMTMVDVLCYNWQDFSARVAVMDPDLSGTGPFDESQSSVISCPALEEDELSVPLMELLVIQDEDKARHELELAAYALNQFQFFHRYLWRPWDNEQAEPTSGPAWFLTHLNLRLDLYTQHQVQGNRSPIWVRTQALIREYTALNHEWNDLHAQLDASHDLALEDLEPSFTHLELKMMEIRRQGDLVENLARRGNLQRAQLQELRRKRDVGVTVCHIVRNDQSTSALFDLLERAKSQAFIHEDTVLKFYSSPDQAIEHCLMGDMVLFASGSYGILELGELRLGGTIAGLGDRPKDTYVISSVQYDFLDDTPNLKVVNLTLICDT
ncbi:testicular spindle-associated protein SHCBP1L-like [Tigriopus californicus]|nr:testicular spindle-associated protein SHCBP1L-like [Tigriopus californicus]